MTEELPLVPGSILGRRCWKFVNGELLAPIHDTVWETEMTAECRYNRSVLARDPGHLKHCRCGLWAHFGAVNPRDRDGEYFSFGVIGVIQGYGETLVGEKGFRSTKAKILALAPAPGSNFGFFPHRYYSHGQYYRLGELKKAFPEVSVYRSYKKMFKDFPVPAPVIS